jgi:hypothetical protein
MKRLFILIAVCMIGMVLPQGVLAAVYNADNLMVTTSDDGKTVTIHSDQSSALWALFSFGDETTKQNIISAIQGANGPGSQIIFDGEFSGSDLEILNSKNCCVQETVNMAETTFKKHIDLRDSMGAYKINWNKAHGGGNDVNKRLNGLAEEAGIELQNGDIAVHLNEFYKYNSSTRKWEATTDPCFVSKERMMELVNGQWNACTLANVGGEPTIFKYANNPETHQNEWYALNVNDYESMTFKYWGSNVKTAITSKNAGPEDSASDQLCDGCTNLTTLTLNSGKFPGLGNNVTSLTTVNIKKDVTELGDALFSGKHTVSTVNFETGGTEPLVIGTNCFNECYAMQGGLTIPARTTSLGSGAFCKAGSVDGSSNTAFNELNVTFEGTCQLTTFEKDVFAYSGITSLTVPNSIQEIKTQAFDNCINLQEVIINEGTSLHAIRNRAFQGCNNIDNVWVNVNSDEHLIICEYNAFSFEGLVGQTQEESHMTILHFPEDNNSHPNNFNYYAGEWKKGMAFTQSELNAFKDGIEIKDESGEVTLYYNPDTMNPSFWSQEYGFSAIDHYNKIDGYYHDPDGGNKKYAPANGWQQFAKTDSEREIYITGNVYMTYSTDKPYSLPKGIVAFRVTDYKNPDIDPNSGKMINGTLVLKMIDQVPTQTGMLLISTDQYLLKVDKNRAEEVQSTFYFGDPEGTPQPYPYVMGREGDATSNYLAPAVHDREVGPVSDAPKSTTGVVNVNAHPFTHRNFALSKSTHRFVRLKHYIMPDNKAFLSLTKEMFDNPNEDATQGPNPYNTVAGDYLYNYDPTVTSNGSNGAKPAFIFDYDVEKYGMIWPLASVIDDNMGITTGISTIQQENVAEGIYTIQGVKVSAPNTKGIYIVNGKKVVFK